MQVQKCFIAKRSSGEIVFAGRVHPEDDGEWYCTHCFCSLMFHSSTFSSPPWFEHVIPNEKTETFLNCPYVESNTQNLSSMEKTRHILDSLPEIKVITRWHCIMCNRFYEGDKYCHHCNTGIYSREY